jgi:hypothetical protein
MRVLPSLLWKAFLFACFAAAFLLTGTGLANLLPLPEVPVIQPKLQHLSSRIGEYDTLFLGTSRIYHQIQPRLFDRLTAAAGLPTRSFNAAADGLRPPEDAYVFEHIAALRPPRLRYVFLEVSPVVAALDREKRGTIRAVYWHDWERTWLLLQRAFHTRAKLPWSERLQRICENLPHAAERASLFIRRSANLGRGTLLTDRFRKRKKPKPDLVPLGPEGDGFISTGHEVISDRDRVQYEQELRIRAKRPARSAGGDPISQKALGRLLQLIRSTGAEPVLIIPPTTATGYFLPRPEITGGAMVLDFSDIQKYGALYTVEHRLDGQHLNTAGAVAFTHALGKEFAARILAPAAKRE